MVAEDSALTDSTAAVSVASASARFVAVATGWQLKPKELQTCPQGVGDL